jgi:peptidoglycan/LPS O-acetylase OafA/YrhL
LKKLILFLLLLIPSLARADEPPDGIFTYLYSMGLLLPYTIFSIGLSIYLAVKHKYRNKSLVIKHTVWGVFILALALIIFFFDPVSKPFLIDVVYVFIAAVVAIILPALLRLLSRYK